MGKARLASQDSCFSQKNTWEFNRGFLRTLLCLLFSTDGVVNGGNGGSEGGRLQGEPLAPERCLRIQEAQATVLEAAYLAYMQSRVQFILFKFYSKNNYILIKGNLENSATTRKRYLLIHLQVVDAPENILCMHLPAHTLTLSFYENELVLCISFMLLNSISHAIWYTCSTVCDHLLDMVLVWPSVIGSREWRRILGMKRQDDTRETTTPLDLQLAQTL